MKKIKTILIAFITSFLLIGGLSSAIKYEEVNAYTASETVTDPVEEKLLILVDEAKAETEEWYEANKDYYSKYAPLEIDYYIYHHFDSTLNNSINALPSSEANDIRNCISKNYSDIKYMYGRCFAMVGRMMNYKYYKLVPGTPTPNIDKAYEIIDNFLKNATPEECHGFHIMMKIVDEVGEYTLLLAVCSPFHLISFTMIVPVFCVSYVQEYNSLSEEDRYYVDLFTSKYSNFMNAIVFEIKIAAEEYFDE